MTGSEGGETVTAEVAGDVVPVGEVVVDAGQVTDGLRFHAVAVGLRDGVGGLYIIYAQGGGSRETGEVGTQGIAVGSLTGVTHGGIYVMAAEVAVPGEDLVDVPGHVVGGGDGTGYIADELHRVLHLGLVFRADRHLRLVVNVAVAGVALSLQGDLVTQARDEGEVNLGVGDAVQVDALALTVRVGVGVVLTGADERAGGVVVRYAVVPVLEAFLAGIHIGQRGVPHGIADVGALAPAVGSQDIGLGAEGQPVGDLEVQLQHGAEFFVVVTLADALLAGVVRRSVVTHALGTAADGEVILLADTLAGNLVQPVHPLAVVPGFQFAGRQHAGVVGGSVQAGELRPVFVFVVCKFGTLLTVETILQEGLFVIDHLGHTAPVGDAHLAVEVHDRGAAGTALGGDDDNTVSGTGTVDGGGGGVLQDVDALDIGRVDGVDGAVGKHTVDDQQRLVDALGRSRHGTAGRDGVLTADGHGLGVVAGGAGGRSIAQTGHLGGQGRQGVRVGEGGDVGVVAIVDAGDGAGNVTLAGGTVTDDNHIVQEEGVLLQNNVNRLLTTDCDFHSLVADGGDDQDGIVCCTEAEQTVQVSCYADGRVLDLDSGTDHWFAFGVDDLTGHRRLREHLHADKTCKRYQNESF